MICFYYCVDLNAASTWYQALVEARRGKIRLSVPQVTQFEIIESFCLVGSIAFVCVFLGSCWNAHSSARKWVASRSAHSTLSLFHLITLLTRTWGSRFRRMLSLAQVAQAVLPDLRPRRAPACRHRRHEPERNRRFDSREPREQLRAKQQALVTRSDRPRDAFRIWTATTTPTRTTRTRLQRELSSVRGLLDRQPQHVERWRLASRQRSRRARRAVPLVLLQIASAGPANCQRRACAFSAPRCFMMLVNWLSIVTRTRRLSTARVR